MAKYLLSYSLSGTVEVELDDSTKRLTTWQLIDLCENHVESLLDAELVDGLYYDDVGEIPADNIILDVITEVLPNGDHDVLWDIYDDNYDYTGDKHSG